MFLGKYKYSIDTKGRVSIPAKMRKSVNPSANDTFVMTIGTENCIAIYPMDEWKKYVKKKIKKLNESNKRAAWIKRKIFSEAMEDKLDTQARLLIPKHLLEHAKLEKDALIVGVMEKMEIWNPNHYEEYLNRDNLSYPDEVESVMGENEIKDED